MHNVKTEEAKEQKRHDNLYKNTEPENLVIEPRHWEKFDTIKKTHPLLHICR